MPPLTPAAASWISAATASGCETYTAWLPLTSTTVEPARLDMACWASGGIPLSSVAMRYETGHLRIVPGFSDYCSTVGVANENRRAVLCCQSPLGVRYVVVQRYRRILDDGDPVAVSRQDLVYGSPSRAVHKATVNQDNVVHHSHPPFLKVNGYFASDP